MSALKFKHDKKEYTSKQFDFKTMCLINEKQCDESIKGPLMVCNEAVEYLFEGTEGEAILEDVAPGVRSRLCINVWEMYIEELTRKNE